MGWDYVFDLLRMSTLVIFLTITRTGEMHPIQTISQIIDTCLFFAVVTETSERKYEGERMLFLSLGRKRGTI